MSQEKVKEKRRQKGRWKATRDGKLSIEEMEIFGGGRGGGRSK